MMRLCVITHLLIALSLHSCSVIKVTAARSALIYVDNSSKSNCSLINLMNDTLCDIDITEYSNFTSLTCPDLDTALNYITTTSNKFSSAVVCLPSGTFTLRKSWSLNISVLLTGHKADNSYPSIIHCQYNDTQSTNVASTANELEYVLSFHNVLFVRLQYVQFRHCPQPLRIELSYNVSILNCAFTNFTEAVLDIYNSIHVSIANSNFSNNLGTGNVLLPFRGNSGAVAIGYSNKLENKSISVTNQTILVRNCVFTNNRANASIRSFLTSSNIVARGIFTGRGGGLSLLINESFHNITALVADCQFINNFASSFGGGIYVVFNGINTQHMVTVDDCQFINNTATLGAGGINIAYLTNGEINYPITALIRNSHFFGNQGETGGATYIFPASTFGGDGNVAYIENCFYESNEASGFGGAIAAATYALFRTTEHLPLYHIYNSTFKHNRCPDGIVNIGYIPLILYGRNVFMSNRGPALRVIGSLVQIQDEIDFIENEAQDGGALYINSFGQIRIFPNTTMLFERNKGQIGASIVVMAERFSSVFNKLINNPQCFILYDTAEIPFLDISNLNFTFINNSALEADAMFLLSALQCSWIGNLPPYFDAGSILNWSFVNVNKESKNDSHIETVATDIKFINKTVSGWPGEQLHIPIEITDQINQLASEFIQLEPVDSNNQPTTKYKVQPTLRYQRGGVLPIRFAVEETQESIKGGINTTIAVRELSIGTATGNFTVNITSCLIGYQLANDPEFDGLTCQCHNDLGYIRNCEDDQRTILLTDGRWGLAQHGHHDNLVVYPCPPGYCRCFHDHSSLGEEICSFAYFNGEPDRQCNCDRQGYLCGDCKDGKGVSALLNNCVDCSDVNSILIAVLIIMDALLISTLLFKEVKFSALLFPIIFFINMVSYVGEDFPTSYDQVGKYIYFINSLLSLYFPYDFCLYSGVTSLTAYTFRYFPIFLMIIIFSAGIPFLRFNFKKIKSFPSYSLWLLITLQYSHVVHTSMTILNCPQVINEKGEHESRWFVKGTLNCFTGRHALLGVVAIFLLLACALLIPFLGLVATGKLKRPYWTGQLAKCIKSSFREELPWWCVVESSRKFLFILFLIPFPQNTFPPLLILMVTFTLYAFMLPYQDVLVNIIELSFQLCFLILLMLRSTRNIVTDYHVFPDRPNNITDVCSNENGTAKLTWLLFPFAYLPLIVIVIIFSIKGTNTLRQHISRYFKDSKVTKNDSQRQQRASTIHLNASNARHLTFDFIGDVFAPVTKKKSTRKGTRHAADNTEVGVTHTEDNMAGTESADTTVM